MSVFEDLVERFCAEAVCSRDELLGTDRPHWLVHPRQDLMLALHERGYSYHAIGRLIGDRDHRTVSRSVKRARVRRGYPRCSQVAPSYSLGGMTNVLRGRLYEQYLGDASVKEGSV